MHDWISQKHYKLYSTHLKNPITIKQDIFEKGQIYYSNYIQTWIFPLTLYILIAFAILL